MVSIAVLTVLLVILFKVTDGTQRIWQSTNSRIEEFRNARTGFETMTRRLSQATLNTYWGYYPNSTAPTSYTRQSELRYVNGSMSVFTPVATGTTSYRPTHGVFFQAPLGFVADDSGAGNTATTNYAGLENLLNTFGYYVEFGSDNNLRPSFINALSNPPPLRYRFRLMELMESSQDLTLYKYTSGIGLFTGTNSTSLNCTVYESATSPCPATTSGTTTGLEWFTAPIAAGRSQVLAENIIAVVILPKLSPQDEQSAITSGSLTGQLGTNLAPGYGYDTTAHNANSIIDSKSQLPPVVQITMVAVDEASYSRAQGSGTSAPTDTLGNSNLGLGTLFQTGTASTVGSLTNSAVAGYAKDLQTLTNTLLSKHINYRVFSTDVVIKGAKWSRAQTN